MAGAETPPPPPKTDINSLFFLGPQHRPGDFITSARFNGANYDEWAADLETALQARSKFRFLDGTILRPEAPYTQADWTIIHAMLVSWIMNTINREVKATLSKYKDAKRLWDTLKERFYQVNGPRIQQLKAAIAKCEQPKTMTVATYYDCRARCIAGREHELRRDKDKLHEFLMGLNPDYYGQIRSSILSQDPLPSLNRAYQLVTQEERVRSMSAANDDKPEAVGFSVQTNGKDRVIAATHLIS